MIGEIDEINSAVIAPVTQPAGKTNHGASMCLAEFTARVRSISVHF
jgi:hypothetical protein